MYQCIFLLHLFIYPGTCEIVNVIINATSLLGPWQADCSFISCTRSIGCLVFLNETFCTASYTNSSSSLSCPLLSKTLIPEPGVYAITAYAVSSNGSYRDCVYRGVTVLKNQGIQDFIKI